MNKYLEKIALFGFSDKEKIDSLSKRFHMDTWNHYSDSINKNIKGINDGYKGEVGQKYYDHVVKAMRSDKDMYESYKPIHAKYVAGMKKHHKKYDTTKMDHKVSMDSFVDQMAKNYKDSQ
jgi:hypothetical protein